jgi:hypothetical protein
MTDKPDEHDENCKCDAHRLTHPWLYTKPDEKPTVEKWADKLAADSVAAGEAEYGPDYKPTTGLADEQIEREDQASKCKQSCNTWNQHGVCGHSQEDFARRIEGIVREDAAIDSERRFMEALGDAVQEARKDERERADVDARRKILRYLERHTPQGFATKIADAILRGEE